jgi:ribosomal protein S18 acetylase RimI-like enzyme
MTLEDHDLEPSVVPPRPAHDGSDIRKLTDEDVPTIANSLARAFEDDPVLSWVVPDDAERLVRLENAFALYLRKIWLNEEECYATDRLFGAALWLPPGKWHLGPLQQLRLLPSMIAVNGRNLPRLITVLRLIEKKHPKPEHYYLAVLGLEPEFQGRGFGGALMRPVLSRCDRERSLTSKCQVGKRWSGGPFREAPTPVLRERLSQRPQLSRGLGVLRSFQ